MTKLFKQTTTEMNRMDLKLLSIPHFSHFQILFAYRKGCRAQYDIYNDVT